MIFLDLPEKLQKLQQCRATILPIPYDQTTSWKQGTGDGPKALIDASHHIELYDEELEADIASSIGGIHTFAPLTLPADPAMARDHIKEESSRLVQKDKLMISLGGEHSITFPLVEAHADHWEDLCVLQIDAHADLREEYNGSRFNHACPMRRIMDRGIHVTAVGIRSVDESEAPLLNGPLRKTFLDCETTRDFYSHIPSIIDSLPGDNVYVTIDLDGLNPSEMAAVGTPIPGGLSWHHLVSLLRQLAAQKNVIGADVVELMPLDGLHSSDSLAARLVYKLIGYTLYDSNNRR